MKNILGIFLLIILVSFVSCKRNEPVSQIHTFKTANWERFEHLNFEFAIEDAGNDYDVSVVIKHTAKFPTESLYLNMVMITPGGEERIKDYNLFLKDRDGNYIGYETDGLFNCTIKVREGLRIHEAGLLKFEIENLMPKYHTPGIIEFGIVMEPTRE